MLHAFVPMTNGSPRCARCLRMLDCAPHLPWTLPAKWIEPGPPYRTGMSIGTQRRAAEWFATHYPPPAVSRAAR